MILYSSRATGDPTFLHPDFVNQPVYEFLKNTNKTIVMNTSKWKEKRWGNGWAWNDYNDDYMAERSAMPMYGNVARLRRFKKYRVSPPCFANKLIRDNMQNYDSGSAPVQSEISSNNFLIKGNDSLHDIIEIPFYTEDDTIVLNLLKDTLHKTVFKSLSSNKELKKRNIIPSQQIPC